MRRMSKREKELLDNANTIYNAFYVLKKNIESVTTVVSRDDELKESSGIVANKLSIAKDNLKDVILTMIEPLDEETKAMFTTSL